MNMSKTFDDDALKNLEAGIHLLVEDLTETDDKDTSVLYIRITGKSDAEKTISEDDIATIMMCGYPEELAEALFEFMEDDKIFHRFVKRIHILENKRRYNAANNKHSRKTIRSEKE